MSAVLLSLRHPFAVAHRAPSKDAFQLIHVDGCGSKLFIMDKNLGEMLEYVDPVSSVEKLYARHEAELCWHSRCIELPEQFGRSTARVFDLAGAMQLSVYSRTPAARTTYAQLAQRAITEVVLRYTLPPKATVLKFPKRRKGRAVLRSVRS